MFCTQLADQSLLDENLFHTGLFLGAVELENLPLKKDALKELELPFEVKAGTWDPGERGLGIKLLGTGESKALELVSA